MRKPAQYGKADSTSSILVLGNVLEKDPTGDGLFEGLSLRGKVKVVAHTPREPQQVRSLLFESEILVLDPIPYVFISREMFLGTSVRFITVTTSGFDHIDLQGCRQMGIVVSNVPNYARESVAEHAFALLLALLRNVCSADRMVRTGGWDFRPFLGGEIAGKTFGIIGLGNIGSRVAELASAFGARVIACDIRPRQMPRVEMVDLSKLLEEADIISLHADLNSSSLNLLGKEEFRRMKRKPVLLNTARGRLVDEEALVDALQSGKIAGAALDVLREEGPGTRSPWFGLPQVLFSPHVAFSTRESLEKRNRIILENVKGFLSGFPVNRIDREGETIGLDPMAASVYIPGLSRMREGEVLS